MMQMATVLTCWKPTQTDQLPTVGSLPLSERARVEVYLRDLPKPAYQDLLVALDREFTYAFRGCSIIPGLDGSYLSLAGEQLQDRITLIYTDTPYAFKRTSR
jgi:hypothetical protein